MKTYIENRDGTLTDPDNKIYGIHDKHPLFHKIQAEVLAETAQITAFDHAAHDAAVAAAATKANAKAYLAATDWYVVRKAETGTEIPQEISDLRAQARLDADEG
jgi:hypothetical protein